MGKLITNDGTETKEVEFTNDKLQGKKDRKPNRKAPAKPKEITKD